MSIKTLALNTISENDIGTITNIHPKGSTPRLQFKFHDSEKPWSFDNQICFSKMEFLGEEGIIFERILDEDENPEKLPTISLYLFKEKKLWMTIKITDGTPKEKKMFNSISEAREVYMLHSQRN